MSYIPSSTLIHSAQLGDKNWATSAVVAFKVRSERTVMSCSRPMLPAAKEESSVPSSARMVVQPSQLQTSLRMLWLQTSPQPRAPSWPTLPGWWPSLTQGLVASKANQSALDALQVEVNGKSTPASVDLKLANHPTTAAMNSSIASTNNATLATVAATYALKSVVDQLAIDLAAPQTAPDVDQRVATALPKAT